MQTQNTNTSKRNRFVPVSSLIQLYYLDHQQQEFQHQQQRQQQHHQHQHHHQQRPRKMRRVENAINNVEKQMHIMNSEPQFKKVDRKLSLTHMHSHADAQKPKPVGRKEKTITATLSKADADSNHDYDSVTLPQRHRSTKSNDGSGSSCCSSASTGSSDNSNSTTGLGTCTTPSCDDALQSLDPKNSANDNMSPDSYILKLFQVVMNFKPTVRPTLEVASLCPKPSLPTHPFIPPITEEEQANYGTEVVTIVRENDLKSLQHFHTNGNGHSLSCCNRFGESLLHMACRRGYESMVLYFIQDAKVSVRITDDCGRTPLHDALWHKECQYTIVDLLVRTDPVLLLTCDKRGHTPFAYARREHWANWRQFLWDRREHMKNSMDVDEMELFSCL